MAERLPAHDRGEVQVIPADEMLASVPASAK